MNKSNLAVAQSGNPNIGLIQSLYAMFERGDIAGLRQSVVQKFLRSGALFLSPLLGFSVLIALALELG